MTISEKISELRKSRKLTQEQLGEILGVSGQAVSKWESGTSLPYILLLPRLCETLGISTDALLDVPASIKNKNIVKDFCAYARENGRTKTCSEAVSRLYNDVGAPSGGGNLGFIHPKSIRVRMELSSESEESVCFLVDGEGIQRDYLSTSTGEMREFLKIFDDERYLAILRLTSLEHSITLPEIEEDTGFPEDEIRLLLLDLMENHVLSVSTDQSGKRGYVRDFGYMGVMMVLAGCRANYCGGVGINALWGGNDLMV